MAQVYSRASISFERDLQKARWLDDVMCYVNVCVSEWICGFHVAQPGVCCHGDVSSFLFMSPADDLSQGHINPAGPHLRQRGDESSFMYTSQHRHARTHAYVDKQANMRTQTTRYSCELLHHVAWGSFWGFCRNGLLCMTECNTDNRFSPVLHNVVLCVCVCGYE